MLVYENWRPLISLKSPQRKTRHSVNVRAPTVIIREIMRSKDAQ